MSAEPDLEVFRTIAIRNGLSLQFAVKEWHLFEVLSQVISLAGEKLVFKGGTALNKVYLGGLQRFSEDLDFDLGEDESPVTAFGKELAGGIEGYGIKDMRKVRDTLQFYCSFATPLSGTDHIRVDISPKRILTEFPISRKKAASSYAPLSVSGVRTYALEDLTARKLNALAGRAEGKDFYDVFSALPSCGRMGGAIGKMLLSENREETVREFLRRAIARAQKADPRELRNLTNPFIPSAQRPPDWAELRGELVWRLERLLE